MRVRKLTLQEWFLDHQLSYVSRNFTSFPTQLEVDVSESLRAATERSLPFSPTPLVVRAAARLLREWPELNSVPFRTPLGPRILELDTPRVNLPIALSTGEGTYLSAMVLEDADRKSLVALKGEIDAFKRTDPRTLPLGRILVPNRNTWWSRARLRAIHGLVNGVPHVYAQRGGAISVTTGISRARQGVKFQGVSFGPTVVTLGICALQENSRGQTILRVGSGFNHSFVPGVLFTRAMHALGEILADPGLLSEGVDLGSRPRLRAVAQA